MTFIDGENHKKIFKQNFNENLTFKLQEQFSVSTEKLQALKAVAKSPERNLRTLRL